MRLADLKNRRKPLAVDVPGLGVLNIEYDPGFYTTEYETKREALSEGTGSPVKQTADTLIDLLRAWDMTQDKTDKNGNPVMGEDGQPEQEPAPLSLLYSLDLQTLGAILSACVEDVFPNQTRESSLPGGSGTDSQG